MMAENTEQTGFMAQNVASIAKDSKQQSFLKFRVAPTLSRKNCV